MTSRTSTAAVGNSTTTDDNISAGEASTLIPFDIANKRLKHDGNQASLTGLVHEVDSFLERDGSYESLLTNGTFHSRGRTVCTDNTTVIMLEYIKNQATPAFVADMKATFYNPVLATPARLVKMNDFITINT